MKVLHLMLLAGALAIAGACATTKTSQEVGSPAGPEASIDALDAALAAEHDEAKIPALLFRRGHAYLEAAEGIRDRRGEKGADGRPSTEFARLVLGALSDFDAVVNRYPASADAPEALFHIGIAYDYPNLSYFGIAKRYYQRTIESYPGTESARKAGIALAKIETKMQEVLDGRHRER